MTALGRGPEGKVEVLPGPEGTILGVGFQSHPKPHGLPLSRVLLGSCSYEPLTPGVEALGLELRSRLCFSLTGRRWTSHFPPVPCSFLSCTLRMVVAFSKLSTILYVSVPN